MKYFPIAYLALGCCLVAATPIIEKTTIDYSQVIREQIKKRQDMGAVPGLPPALAGLVPMMATMGILPGIVKSINCRSLKYS